MLGEESMHYNIEDNDDAQGEYYSQDGSTVIHLAGQLTLWGLYDTLIHESLHEQIEENSDPDVTTEKQDHYIIQRLCF